MQAVKFQPKNLQAWNLLGLCQTSMGDIGDGIRAYQRVIDMQPDHREAWVNMAQARKEVRRHLSVQVVTHICARLCMTNASEAPCMSMC
jgi:Tfp pilus assembly protein PilF